MPAPNELKEYIGQSADYRRSIMESTIEITRWLSTINRADSAKPKVPRGNRLPMSAHHVVSVQRVQGNAKAKRRVRRKSYNRCARISKSHGGNQNRYNTGHKPTKGIRETGENTKSEEPGTKSAFSGCGGDQGDPKSKLQDSRSVEKLVKYYFDDDENSDCTLDLEYANSNDAQK